MANPPSKWKIAIGFPVDWKPGIHQAAKDLNLNVERWLQFLVRRELDQQENAELVGGDGGEGDGVGEEFEVETPVPEQYAAELSPEQLMAEMSTAMNQLEEDFQYPQNAKGDQMDMRFLTPWVAFHLVRCGWRPVDARRMIKKRPATYIPPGCYEDLVEWVPIDTPDVLDPTTMTLEQLKTAPASVQAQAIREMNGRSNPLQPPGTPLDKTWRQPIQIDIDDPEFEELQKEAKT
jgi:hypothetical protein